MLNLNLQICKIFKKNKFQIVFNKYLKIFGLKIMSKNKFIKKNKQLFQSNKIGIFCILILLIITKSNIYTQSTTQSPDSFDFNTKGVVFQSFDSLLEVRMRFRIQNQMLFQTKSESDLEIDNSLLAVRRLRLRFGGFLYDKDLSYNLQLSFSRADLDFSNTNFPNIIRDAMIFYNFSPKLQLSFGQTKLPGNRQRVVSSSDMQFAERSIVNNSFTMDRDFGIQGWYGDYLFDDFYFNLRGAFTDGEGRNSSSKKGSNYSYTARAEILPLGKFTNGGDYIESDIEFEPKPKISIGASINRNVKTERAGGQIGALLYTPVTLKTLYLDGLFKYNGFALYTEFATRNAEDNPITQNSNNDIKYTFEGIGYLLQTSFLFKNNYEIAIRYADVEPTERLKGNTIANQQQIITFATSKYISGHRAKLQAEISYLKDNSFTFNQNNNLQTNSNKYWQFIFNLELGI